MVLEPKPLSALRRNCEELVVPSVRLRLTAPLHYIVVFKYPVIGVLFFSTD